MLEDMEIHPSSNGTELPWYKKNPELFQSEKEAMAREYPDFVLDSLDDDRKCWIGSFTPGSDETVWTIMVVYENDCTNDCGFKSDSIRVYSIEPDLNEMQDEVLSEIQKSPHIHKDSQENLYLSFARFGENGFVASAASTISSACQWIADTNLWPLRDNALFERFVSADIGFERNNPSPHGEALNVHNGIDLSRKALPMKTPKHVVFSTRAFTALLAETKEKFKTETGGIFLGIMQGEVWYIIETIDPGPKSIFQPAYFEYDGDYVRHLANKVNRLYGDGLDVIGLWHRHPGSMDTFSNTDYGTIKKFAAQNNGITISALVNIDPNFRLTVYVGKLQNHLTCDRISYEVNDSRIPSEVASVQYYNDIVQTINAMSLGRNTSITASKSNLHRMILEYLKKLSCRKATSEDIAKNTEEERDSLIEEFIANECLYCDEIAVSYSCEINDNNQIEFIIGEDDSDLRFTFFVCDFPCAMDRIKKGKIWDSVLEKFNLRRKKTITYERQPCFTYKENLYPYAGNLVKSAWEASKK